MGAVERFERQLCERLEAAPESQRPVILREAVDLAKPLIASRQMTKPRAVATLHAIGRQHGIRTLKSTDKAKGLFAGPPFHNDDGPEAA
jgi:hypothetical protein